MEKKIEDFFKGQKLSIDEINKLLPCTIKLPDENTINVVPKKEDAPVALTKREKEIVGLIKSGFTNKEISLEIGIAYETVKTHRKNIFNKLGVNNISELMHLNSENHG